VTTQNGTDCVGKDEKNWILFFVSKGDNLKPYCTVLKQGMEKRVLWNVVRTKTTKVYKGWMAKVKPPGAGVTYLDGVGSEREDEKMAKISIILSSL
jgi:hypothetical protein